MSFLCYCRGELVQRVASMLNARLLPLVQDGLFPSWHVFGSSANTFGLDTSDVDMCVIWKSYDGNLVSPPISPPDIVTIAAAVANEMGMLEVRAGLCFPSFSVSFSWLSLIWSVFSLWRGPKACTKRAGAARAGRGM